MLARTFPLYLWIAVGCTKTDSDTGTADTTDTTPAGAPGTITVSAADVVGYTGKVLLAVAYLDGTGPALGAMCAIIDADPFSATAELSALVGSDPCTLGDPVEFEAGTYTIDAGILTGGETTPEACAPTEVVVDGDVAVTLPAMGPC